MDKYNAVIAKIDECKESTLFSLNDVQVLLNYIYDLEDKLDEARMAYQDMKDNFNAYVESQSEHTNIYTELGIREEDFH